MKVKTLMTTRVVTCAEYNTLNTAAQLMWENDCGCLPVVDREGRLIGIVTDRDVCMAAYIQGAQLNGVPVVSAMSRKVISCKPDDDVLAAELMMRQNKVRRLPVMRPDRRLAGIISLDDIAREGHREHMNKLTREISDAEIARTMAAVSEPQHRIIQAYS